MTATGTVHIVSVGLSLFGNLRAEPAAMAERHRLDREVAESLHARRKRLRDAEDSGDRDRQAERVARAVKKGEEAHTEFTALLREVRVEEWKPGLSAELSALAAYLGRPADGPGPGTCALPSQDTAVLIASDTGPGLRAALVNAAAMAGGDLGRVHYLHDPSDAVASLDGAIVIVRVPGLDARDTAGFIEAMRDLGGVGRGVRRMVERARAHGAGERVVRFHTSGGFKGALPFVLGMAEALRSILGPRMVKAYAVHELSSGSAVEMPLRSFHREFLERQFKGVERGDGVFRTEPPDGKPLQGFAYDFDSDKREWRLTPFGYALNEMLPEATKEP
ncbi:hypothetical protein [Nocardiopsis suaedae]|uniref:CRISPR-associated protein n=1 Tax=Nocardiopsis suaedae TaxID=3018444 RepID=A0ABT4TSW1_9ACTN|nr:hypothetical protein [Nocardiopsis suaedae]MDA2807779.1 hypothetical protein [Nocardiopsis suaedae]